MLTRYVRQILEEDERLQTLSVEGEVSEPRMPASGHLYFTLKDEQAQLKCVMWRSALARQEIVPQHGESVIAYGYLSVYEAGGAYQLYCTAIVPVGAGDLHARLEALKARLQAEGLFDTERKRPLPELPNVIGVVTSPDAAAFQDVLNVLRRRYPLAHVLLAPTLVQGDEAPSQIVAALAALNAREDVDVILLVRGGGSLEDLWAFNDELVVRAVAASRIPVVAGVGHEVDVTLADLAADLRTPTPSVAAELVTPTLDELADHLARAKQRLCELLEHDLERQRLLVKNLERHLSLLSPQTLLGGARQRLDELDIRMHNASRSMLRLRRERVRRLAGELEKLDPLATLARGYAVVTDLDDASLREMQQVAIGDEVRIRLYRGILSAIVKSKEEIDE